MVKNLSRKIAKNRNKFVYNGAKKMGQLLTTEDIVTNLHKLNIKDTNTFKERLKELSSDLNSDVKK